ncbi:hypothetical protein [Nocardia abscessus]|uniref:hypothetical protein n=1 Tax=Nocardia abscessus TaxID=120957 RepID=UPI0024544B94|nr:hypothetical protein [Nocardia abscessus]
MQTDRVAQGLAQSMGGAAVLSPNLVVHHEDCQYSARRTLGRRAFEAAYREGAALGLYTLIDYALGEPTRAAEAIRGIATDISETLAGRRHLIQPLHAVAGSGRAARDICSGWWPKSYGAIRHCVPAVASRIPGA